MKLYFAMNKQMEWDSDKREFTKNFTYVPRRAHSGPFAGYSSAGKAKQYAGKKDSYVVEVETDDFLPLESSLDEQIRHAENMMLRWGERLSALEAKARGE